MKTKNGADVDCDRCSGGGLVFSGGLGWEDCLCKTQKDPKTCVKKPIQKPDLNPDSCNGWATGVERRLQLMIAQRQLRGRAAYGTTVEENPMPLRDWLAALRDEMLDGAIYAQRAIEELEKKERWKDVPAS